MKPTTFRCVVVAAALGWCFRTRPPTRSIAVAGDTAGNGAAVQPIKLNLPIK